MMKEVVSFFLSGKEYGVDVNNMKGIDNYKEVTPVAGSPEFVLGMVEARDEMIPVIDIRKRFVLPPVGVTEETKHLLLHTDKCTIACVADGVSNIFKVEGERLQNFPSLMKTEGTGYVDFVAKNAENNLVIVINPNNILNEEEWDELNKMIDKMEAEK